MTPGDTCPTDTHTGCEHPPGATLYLGGTAWAHPALQPHLQPLADLIPYPGNPRRGDQDAITASVADLGIYKLQITHQTSTRHILTGNHTARALLALDAVLAPTTPLNIDDIRAAAINARDNHTSDVGGYDLAEQVAQLVGLQDAEALALAGRTDDDLAALQAMLREEEAGSFEGQAEPDAAPDVPAGPPISTLGDVWRLGAHRLVVGDATDPAAYDALLGGDQAACVWTDPPYGVSYVGKTKDAMTIQNDGREGLQRLLVDSLGLTIGHARPGGAVYVAAPPGPQGTVFWQTLLDLGTFRQLLVWVKDVFVLGHSDYHYKHELIFYGYVPGAEGRRGRGGEGWFGDNAQTSVWEIPRPKRSEQHPTMKPVELVARALRNSTRPGNLVLDPFGGSGTTLIACQQEDRTARLIELDPKYADVICRRFQQFTGIKPVRDDQPVDFTDA